jgi:hypothetical protein
MILDESDAPIVTITRTSNSDCLSFPGSPTGLSDDMSMVSLPHDETHDSQFSRYRYLDHIHSRDRRRFYLLGDNQPDVSETYAGSAVSRAAKLFGQKFHNNRFKRFRRRSQTILMFLYGTDKN